MSCRRQCFHPRVRGSGRDRDVTGPGEVGSRNKLEFECKRSGQGRIAWPMPGKPMSLQAREALAHVHARRPWRHQCSILPQQDERRPDTTVGRLLDFKVDFYVFSDSQMLIYWISDFLLPAGNESRVYTEGGGKGPKLPKRRVNSVLSHE